MKKCLNCGRQFQLTGWVCPSCGHAPIEEFGHWLFAPELSKESASYDPERHKLTAEAEETHFWFQTRTEALVWAFGKFFPKAESYLEVGCGTGFVISRLRQAFPALRIVGSDLLLSGLKRAGARLPEIELLQMDVLHIPYEDEFSVIGAYDVLEHIEDDRTALAQFHRALVKGGGLLLTVPQHPSLWSRHDEQARHVRRYTAPELRAKVEQAGFRIERMTSLYAATLPLMWLSRQLAGRWGGDGNREFRPSPSLNRALYAVLRIERALIRWGFDFPVGGSLLVAARKV